MTLYFFYEIACIRLHYFWAPGSETAEGLKIGRGRSSNRKPFAGTCFASTKPEEANCPPYPFGSTGSAELHAVVPTATRLLKHHSSYNARILFSCKAQYRCIHVDCDEGAIKEVWVFEATLFVVYILQLDQQFAGLELRKYR